MRSTNPNLRLANPPPTCRSNLQGLVHLVCAILSSQSIPFAAQINAGLSQLLQAESLRVSHVQTRSRWAALQLKRQSALLPWRPANLLSLPSGWLCSSLQPIFKPSGPAGQGMSMHKVCLPEQRPGAPPVSSLTFLQMLVAGMLLGARTELGPAPPEQLSGALHCVNEAVLAAWPASTDVAGLAIERHLAARSWVPDLEQTAAPEWIATPLSRTAAALQRDLQRHTPEVSPTELRCLALLLRASRVHAAPKPATSAERAQRSMIRMVDGQQALALSSGAAPGSLLESIHFEACADAVMAAAVAGEPAVCGTGAAYKAREDEWMRVADELLQRCLDDKREWRHIVGRRLPGKCLEVAWKALEVAWKVLAAPRCANAARVPGLLASLCQLLRPAGSHAGWMAANAHARSLASLHYGSAQRMPDRGSPLADFLAAQLLRKAEQLLDTARGCLPHLRRWLPQLQVQAYEQYQLHFEEGLAAVKQGAWKGMRCLIHSRAKCSAGVAIG